MDQKINKKELVSIIVPIFNVEKYLRKCIDSIINQTYDNLEIILVDDGSPDQSGKICDEYAAKDRRIKVIHKENEGVSEARNIGIKLSSGEFILFVDSDDYIEAHTIEIMIAIAKQRKADIVMADIIFVDEFDQEIKESEKNKTKDEEKKFIEYTKDQAIDRFVRDDWGPWNKLYRASIHKNIYFPKGKIHEDEAIMFQILDNCNKMIKINNKLYYYRKRMNSTTSAGYSLKKMDWLEAWEENVLFLEKNYPQVENKAIDKLVMVALYNLDNLLKRNDNDDKIYIQEIISILNRYIKKILFNPYVNIRKKMRVLLIVKGKEKIYRKLYIK